MYAVIETGGKQYRVELGTELEVELLDAEAGQSVTLDRVLLVADGDEASIGRPLVANAAVQAEVVRQTRGEKVISFKYRPKARRRVKKGHRQELMILRVTDVLLDGRSAADAARKAEQAAKTERERLAEAAARQAAEDAKLAAKLAAQAKPAKGAATDAGAAEPAVEAPAKPKRARAAAKPTPAPAAEAEAATDTAPEAGTAPEAPQNDPSETETSVAPKRPRAKKSE